MTGRKSSFGKVCGLFYTMKKTLVTGASENPVRYSNKAIRLLRQMGYEVVALGLRPGKVLDVEFVTGQPEIQDIDTITMYLGAKNQKPLEDYFISLQPRRIIINPGAANPSLEKKALDANIEVIHDCTLVMLRVNGYDL